MENSEKKVLILGLGGAGGKVVSRIAAQRISGLDTVAVDCDIHSLDSLDSNVGRLVAGTDWNWTPGSGCGGDVIRGEQVISNERQRIMELIDGKDLIIVVAGLGGGIATGGIRTVASTIRSKKIPSVFMLTTPFSFESFAKRKAADDCIKQLLPVTDILLRLPNDLLFSMLSPDSSVEQAFSRSCDELARTVIGICGILNCKNALNVDYAGFMALLRGKKCQCGIGVGIGFPTAENPDRSGTAIRNMLQSPFLGGTDKLSSADAMIVSICAGPGLQLGEMKRTLESLAALGGSNTEVISGFSTAPFMGQALQAAVITVFYDPEEKQNVQEKHTVSQETKKIGTAVKRSLDRKKKIPELEQGILELTNYSKGIFVNTVPVFYGDDDLDIPTFQRKGIPVNKGYSAK